MKPSGRGASDVSHGAVVQHPIRVTSLRSPNIRRYKAPQCNITPTQEFIIRKSHRLQFKVSGFKVSNSPFFNSPNTTPSSSLSGVLPPTQINSPRSIELGFRYLF
jgi:hypothetical protein